MEFWEIRKKFLCLNVSTGRSRDLGCLSAPHVAALGLRGWEAAVSTAHSVPPTCGHCGLCAAPVEVLGSCWAQAGLLGGSRSGADGLLFLECVIFPLCCDSGGKDSSFQRLLTLCSNQKWPLSLRSFQMEMTSPRSPKRASHHSSLSFFFQLVLIVSQPF